VGAARRPGAVLASRGRVPASVVTQLAGKTGTMWTGCGFSPVRAAGAGTWRPGCHFLPGCPGPGPAQAGRDHRDV